MQLLFSRQAEADLEDIGDDIAKDNPARAVRFVREIRDHCLRLVSFPDAAPLRPDFGHGVRVSVFTRYLIFYIVHAEILEIRRVVHGARNLADID